MKRLAIRHGRRALAALSVVIVCSTACGTAPPRGHAVTSPDAGESDAGSRAPLHAACEVIERAVGACTLITVPAGHRLVIETVTGRLGGFRGAETLVGPVLQTTVGGVAQRHWLAREFAGPHPTLNVDVYLVTHQLRLYADPGTPVVLEAPDAIGSFTISGYLVKVP